MRRECRLAVSILAVCLDGARRVEEGQAMKKVQDLKCNDLGMLTLERMMF